MSTSILKTLCTSLATTLNAAVIKVGGVTVTATASGRPFPGTYGAVLATQIIVSPAPAGTQEFTAPTQSGGVVLMDTTVNVELVGKYTGTAEAGVEAFNLTMDAIMHALIGSEDTYGSKITGMSRSEYISDEAARNLNLFHAGFEVALIGGEVSNL